MAYMIHLGVILLFYTTAVQCEVCTYRSDSSYLTDRTLYCSNGCCGTYSYQYCCPDYTINVGIIIGAVVGSVVFVIIVVSVIVAVCCCCRRSQGQTGQVYQPSYSAGVNAAYGMPTTNPSYGQTGYVLGAFSGAQIQTANVQPGTAQRWEAPPTMNERTNP